MSTTNNNDDQDEIMQKAREEMRETAERIGSPYIVFEVMNDNPEWEGESPLDHIGLHFELVLNSLMLKYSITQDDNYISFLAYVSNLIENFAVLTSEYGLRLSGYDPRTGEFKKSPNPTEYQIPDIFKDGLKDTDLSI